MVKTTTAETITVLGWRAVPNTKLGGYDIHRPGSYDTYSGHTKTEKAAREWLDKSSGAAYQRLPAVRLDELREVKQDPVRIGSAIYEGTLYYLGDKYVGKTQKKRDRYRTRNEYMTLPADSNGCVTSIDLKWMLEQAGFRLEK